MNNYFIVIDKRDFKKIKTSLVHGNRYSNQKIWAFSTKDNKVYSKIRKNDLVFFAKEGFESWQFALKVSKKKKDMKFVWDNDFRSKNKNLILFLCNPCLDMISDLLLDLKNIFAFIKL